MLRAGAPAALMSLALLSGGHASAAPLVVAHRGGTGDAPENTLTAIRSALKNQADVLWITVQISSDGVPVLYRPANVAALSDGQGLVNTLTLAQLQQLNVGHAFSRNDADGQKTYPYRAQALQMPTLQEALRLIPKSVPILIDLKQLPAAPLVAAVAQVLGQEQAWDRIRVYSTEAEILRLMANYPQARLFESRDATRDRLSSVALSGACEKPPSAGSWVGMEFERTVTVVEKFTLGEGTSVVKARWWTPAAVSCFKTHPDVKIVLFGIDSAAAYQAAEALGIDHVMTDSPRKMKTIRATK
ncbi:glycerophosphodiester phosphodiesterase family protein [Polaromonas sp. OV174]|uniref:glycerophosphodiester phosphodiesterase family protein n=1 Tax=Polaromonas sp. OV174 TaxID=1855300 RepID=UPI000B842202|nr:glycerophosphodiester phosphodiesterase family protein [Polaromonas sp. OV174]